MSINIKQQVKCPKCGQLSEVTVWQSITASDSADLKEDLLKGKINMFRCPSCSLAALMPNPMLYTDSDKKLMITFSPCSDETEKYRLFDSVKTVSKDSGELEGLNEYNLRFVSSYNELLEKILIYECGLHDKVIELLKLLVLMQDTEKMQNRTCMFGKLENNEIEFMVQDKKENQVYTSRVPMDTYRTVEEQLRQSGIKYKSFDWEIVDGEYASRMLYGMNNNM